MYPSPCCTQRFIVNQTFLTLSIVAIVSLSMINRAHARPEFANELGVSGQCILCHTSPLGGGDTVKNAALQAFNSNGIRPGLENYLKSLQNAKPVILPINKEWNVHIGQTFSIPLVINDDEDQGFTMELTLAKPALIAKTYAFSTWSLNSKGQPNLKFNWQPVNKQAPGKYSLSFRSYEVTTSGNKQYSNTINANAYLWAARPVSTQHVIDRFTLDNAGWKANKLTLTGKIDYKKSASAQQRATALKTLRLKIKSFTNTTITNAVSLNPNSTGNWTLTLPLTSNQTPCVVKTEFEQLIAARTVQGVATSCKK